VLRVDAPGSDAHRGAERLLHEARAAAALEHANTIAIYDVGEVGDTPFIAMELVSGRSLRAVIGDPNVSSETRVRYLTDVARALLAGHERGIIHRDVKPENVLVRDDGVVKVVDFGIARTLGSTKIEEAPAMSADDFALHVFETVTRTGLVGTPRYMAPEQLIGNPIDERTDQFAWGVVAYELLTGRSPWDEGTGTTSVALVASIVGSFTPPIEPLTRVTTPTVVATVMRALAKRPSERFASMAEIVDALSAARVDVPVVGGRRRLVPFVPDVEVNGALVQAVLDGFGTFRAVALKYAVNFGGIDDDGVIRNEWASHEAWLAAHEKVILELGGAVLFNIGQNIPDNAREWPEATDIDAAMKVLDIAYHLNHRRKGKVMYDGATGVMTEGIGHYLAARDPEQKRITMTCDNPYPCELDHGIITAIARRYGGHVEHAPIGCRTLGASSCTYVVTWA
jgi:serine/threonine-protein kinase